VLSTPLLPVSPSGMAGSLVDQICRLFLAEDAGTPELAPVLLGCWVDDDTADGKTVRHPGKRKGWGTAVCIVRGIETGEAPGLKTHVPAVDAR